MRHPVIDDAELPVFIANFILMEYGTGAIFGCPAHDQRDLEFARRKDLPVIPVVLPSGEDARHFRIGDEAYTGDGTLINSGFLDGLGVGYFPEILVSSYIANGRLVRLLEDWCGRFPGLYLFYPSRRQMPGPLRAFVDFMREHHTFQSPGQNNLADHL